MTNKQTDQAAGFDRVQRELTRAIVLAGVLDRQLGRLRNELTAARAEQLADIDRRQAEQLAQLAEQLGPAALAPFVTIGRGR